MGFSASYGWLLWKKEDGGLGVLWPDLAGLLLRSHVQKQLLGWKSIVLKLALWAVYIFASSGTSLFRTGSSVATLGGSHVVNLALDTPRTLDRLLSHWPQTISATIACRSTGRPASPTKSENIYFSHLALYLLWQKSKVVCFVSHNLLTLQPSSTFWANSHLFPWVR